MRSNGRREAMKRVQVESQRDPAESQPRPRRARDEPQPNPKTPRPSSSRVVQPISYFAARIGGVCAMPRKRHMPWPLAGLGKKSFSMPPSQGGKCRINAKKKKRIGTGRHDPNGKYSKIIFRYRFLNFKKFQVIDLLIKKIIRGTSHGL